ncbi:glycosyltransferase family 4 protein [Geobacter sp. DSM 9736]|uniref:glycosyltransferase family 4 protein n=1 Tax=Geobacter sp. DSM 9736 TaxID=1277350 RepID=UPI000B512B42|nr:glycosyltransferase family 4 protein [Geobacter sp. DSM 9736]SNB46616.1 Glycosyltransferase involved in cell wall bisynthesis [Geobacter sp. DSM 9736]
MDADVSRETVLIISHINPANPTAGNERRLFNLIRWLRGEGYRVELLLNLVDIPYAARQKLHEVVDAVHSLPSSSFVDILSDRFCGKSNVWKHQIVNRLSPPSLMQSTAKVVNNVKPAAVISEYIFAAPCLAAVPGDFLKLIDTHDMYSRRAPGDPYYCQPELERELLLLADIVIAIQRDEAAEFARLVPERTVITAGIDYDVETRRSSEVESGSILLVGSDNNANIDGFHHFFSFAWSRIRALCPSAQLRVIGKIGNNFSCADDRVKLYGWVESLDEEYARAAVVINPTFYGTGLKIKTVEALCKGKAVVATSNSVEGLEAPPCRIEDDWNKFAEAVVDLVSNPEKRRAYEAAAYSYASQNFSSQQVYAELSSVLRRNR